MVTVRALSSLGMLVALLSVCALCVSVANSQNVDMEEWESDSRNQMGEEVARDQAAGKLEHLLLRLRENSVLAPKSLYFRKRNSAVMEAIKDLPDIAHMNNVGR